MSETNSAQIEAELRLKQEIEADPKLKHHLMQLRLLIAMREAGASLRTIARVFHTSHTQIRRVLMTARLIEGLGKENGTNVPVVSELPKEDGEESGTNVPD